MSPLPSEVLKLDGVWRRYRRWKRRPASLKEAFIRLMRRDGLAYKDFWALQDISLTVCRGEILGVCGANGSGKSTLLKVIARIVPATHGYILVRERIATLLELGSGFLSELSGRENIALNGAIMGISDADMARKSASIIEFADIGEFIDSPVKTYSTGMYMRLGFAIASHIEAEILLLDELLGVGDAEFQKKCLNWLHQLRNKGVTALLVSHDLPTLFTMCDRVIWLDKGRVVAQGLPGDVLRQYSPEAVLPIHKGSQGILDERSYAATS
jgi:ABC-type polysaccharide/polyol phosphate transport system ATPase subunit